MKTTMKCFIVSTLLSSSLFAAGYILPNGTILYDNSSDNTTYKIESLSVVQQAPVPIQSQNQQNSPEYTVIKSVVIENRTVVYEQPVYIRERVVDRRPFYDIVDIAGAVLVYGLIYDTARHSFYHHQLHKSYPRNRFRR